MRRNKSDIKVRFLLQEDSPRLAQRARSVATGVGAAEASSWWEPLKSSCTWGGNFTLLPPGALHLSAEGSADLTPPG